MPLVSWIIAPRAAVASKVVELGERSWRSCRPESVQSRSNRRSASSRTPIGRDWVFTSDDDLHSYRDHFSYIKDQPNELIPSAAVGPDSDGAGAGDRPDREQVQDSAVRDLDRQELRLRRPVAERARQRHRRSEAHEPHSRGATTSATSRSSSPGVSYIDLYRHIQEHKLKRLGRHAGSRLGQPDRQRDGSRHRLHDGLLPRPLRRAHAAWRSCCRTARSCAPAWARCRRRTAGRNTGTATAPIPRACSARAASASSRRWAFG